MKLADLVGYVEALVLDAAHVPERVAILARSVKVDVVGRSCRKGYGPGEEEPGPWMFAIWKGYGPGWGVPGPR